MDEVDRDELQEAWDNTLTSWDELKTLLRRNLSPEDYSRVHAYGVANVESGLGEGEFLPCMYPVNKFVENLLKESPEKGDEDEASEE